MKIVVSNSSLPDPEWGNPNEAIEGFAVAAVQAGRFSEERPEDRVARKIAINGFVSLSEDEVDISNERLVPLAELFHAEDQSAFEAEYERRRAPGFYDKPIEDDGQGELF